LLDRVPDEEASVKTIVRFVSHVFFLMHLYFLISIFCGVILAPAETWRLVFCLLLWVGIDGCGGRTWASCAGIITGVILSVTLINFDILFNINHILWNADFGIFYSLVIFVIFICRLLKKLGGSSKFMLLKRIQMLLLPYM